MARAKKSTTAKANEATTMDEKLSAVIAGTQGLPEAEVFEELAKLETATAPIEEDAPAEEAKLSALVEAVTAEDRTAKLKEIAANFEARKNFEKSEHPENDSVQDRLKAYEKKMALPGIAAIMVATKVDAGFINRSVTSGKRFNIYAIDKFNDLVHGLNSGTLRNAVNVAVMKSLFRFRKAGIAFTGQMATAAVSDKVKVDKAMQQHLVRHTVSAATAPTQTSSTMNALEVLGVVKNTGSQKFPVWVLTDAPVTKRFEELLAA